MHLEDRSDHWGFWTGDLAGLRWVTHRTGNIDGVSIVAVGTDDGENWFCVRGAFRISTSFFMDFTPIGGQKGWDGIQAQDALLWPDGSKWLKVRGLKDRPGEF